MTHSICRIDTDRTDRNRTDLNSNSDHHHRLQTVTGDNVFFNDISICRQQIRIGPYPSNMTHNHDDIIRFI